MRGSGMPAALKVSALAGLMAAGVLLAGAIGAGAQETTTATTTLETTTTPGTTVVTTATVERTTTRRIVPTGITTSSSSSSETPAWVWVLLGILAVGLVVLIVLLARRGGGASVSIEDRSRRLDTAVAGWTGQGWALESQAADSAVLVRGGERLLVNVDQFGRVSTLPLPNRKER